MAEANHTAAANAIGFSRCPIGPFDCPLNATTEQIERAKRGDGFLFLAAAVVYEDMNGVPHETYVCMIYKPAEKRFGLMENDNGCNHHT
jgi:hypothetical protein